MKAIQDLLTDFKTTFPLKAQVYVQLTYPAQPAFYTIECYLVKEDGQEKLVGTTDIKYFDKKARYYSFTAVTGHNVRCRQI